MIAKDDQQLTFIYNSNSAIGKQALGYIESSEKQILAIDITKTKVPDTQWGEILDTLKIPLQELLDTTKIEAETGSFSTQDWITILQKTPNSLKSPVAINGDRMKAIETPTDILTFFEVDSAGLKKEFHTNTPTTSSTTEGESFIE